LVEKKRLIRMLNRRMQLFILAGASVMALADFSGLLTGIPHSIDALRIAGFTSIATGIFLD